MVVHTRTVGRYLGDETANYGWLADYRYGDAEIWTYSISQDVFRHAPMDFFRFAVSYTVNGKTYWDNNCGMDYKGTADF